MHLPDTTGTPPRRRRRVAAAVAALLVATLAPTLPAQAADTISVSGRVTDQADQPIAGLVVSVVPDGGGLMRSATTASDGRFTVTQVTPGRSELSVDDDWAADDLWRHQTWNGTSGVEGWTTFETGTSDVTGVTFRLRPTSGFVGHAVDENGDPLRNIAWDVYEQHPDTGAWLGRQYGPLLTDEGGRMWFPADPGTTWRLCFSDSWYQPADEGGGTWMPTRRHLDGCWSRTQDSGATLAQASDITFTDVGQRRDLVVEMPDAGKALTLGYPAVVGATDTGSTLTAVPGTWGPGTVSLSYQWYTWSETGGQQLIPGATGTTFTTTSAHAGKQVGVQVTGTRSGYAPATRLSTLGAVGRTAPTTASPLTITGTPAPGKTLTASHGALSPAGSSAWFQWFVNGVPAGWGTTLAVTTAHRTATIEVRGAFSTSGAGERVARATVRVPGLAFTPATPTVAGTAVVGQTLTAKVGTWTPTPTTFTYQWYRGSTAISGATGKTYTLKAADRGTRVKVKVTGSRAGYETASRTSAATATVKGVLVPATPTVSGTAKVGRTLTAKVGTWKPSGITFTYRWYRNGTAISGATGKTYVVKKADRGARLHVRVTGSLSGYVSQSRSSATTAKVV
ncbi:carboxypeptidase regulatory-like domain-containing protein [Cellulomonas palmilytica]|uniref:carboxypeptidase regulatory-like domain-containing protein n=1 Tax=Cellulomonas palmilytica TaxID=2608402 RepID=UPI001F3935FA|nr:carboxypeptidase regulatory-like domain-containing protein [Cellulomonas palmilytica]UJP39180.1 carboxypeptidase regulatory-like domain-containing protein [Cellulomonas palmilytica]